jgi:hypothetical protein
MAAHVEILKHSLWQIRDTNKIRVEWKEQVHDTLNAFRHRLCIRAYQDVWSWKQQSFESLQNQFGGLVLHKHIHVFKRLVGHIKRVFIFEPQFFTLLILFRREHINFENLKLLPFVFFEDIGDVFLQIVKLGFWQGRNAEDDSIDALLESHFILLVLVPQR